MVDVCFGQSETSAGVLAASTVPFPKSPQSEAQSFPGNPVEGAQNNDGGNSDFPPDHADRAITFPDRKLTPVVPGKRGKLFFAVNVETLGLTVDHGSEDFSRAGRSDSLPASVENENGGLMEMLGHGMR